MFKIGLWINFVHNCSIGTKYSQIVWKVAFEIFDSDILEGDLFDIS